MMITILIVLALLEKTNAQSAAFVGRSDNGELPTVTVRFGVITDTFSNKPDSDSYVTYSTINTMFNRATALNNVSFVYRYLDGRKIMDRTSTRRQVNIQLMLMLPTDNRQMKKQINDSPYPVICVLEMSNCTTSFCDELMLLARDMPDLSIFSTCCYTWSKDDAAMAERTTTTEAMISETTTIEIDSKPPENQNFMYVGLSPDDVANVITVVRRAYNWRRFHFIISPNWPEFDAFFYDVQRKLTTNDSTIVITSGYYCSRYLASGHLCESDQARKIVTEQATALFMLLDRNEDLPDFLQQLQTVYIKEHSSLTDGKAFFLVDYSGLTLARSGLSLLHKAPDGLMMLRRNFYDFRFKEDDNITQMTETFTLHRYLFKYFRVLGKAIEAYEQQPEAFSHFMNLFCDSVFQFDDSYQTASYPVPCAGSSTADIQVMNYHQIGNGSYTELPCAILNSTSANILVAPYWPGSGLVAPKEDFCKLDGSGCPPEPPNYAAIIAPTIIGFFVLVATIGGILAVLSAADRRRKREAQLLVAEMVAHFSELEFTREDGTETNSRSGTGMSSTSDSTSRPSSRSSEVAEGLITPFPLFARKSRMSKRSSGRDSGTDTDSENEKQTKVSEQKQDEQPALPPDEKDAYGLSLKVRFRGDWATVTRLKKYACTVDESVIQEFIEARNLRHTNVNPFIAVTQDPDRIYYIQACSFRGTLASILSKRKVQLDALFKLSFATDIAAGMAYIHQSSIGSHGRLSSESVYVDSRWFCRVGDIPLPKFEATGGGMIDIIGNLRSSTPNKAHESISGGHLPSVRHGSKKEPSKKRESEENVDPALLRRPNLLWTSPELLKEENPPERGTKKGDVYAFGIILQELITRTRPYAMFNLPEDVMIKKLIAATFPPFRPKLPIDDEEMSDLCDLARLCWEEQPLFRPCFPDIQQSLKKLNKGKDANLIDQMLKMLQQHADELEELVEDRTNALREEEKKSEELLSKMLPRYVLEELKAGRVVEPESYESATIFFSDIVGFTALASQSLPLEIVDFLNELYSQFDTIIDSYDVYKVETIGDAYEVCSGLPQRNENRHAGEIATMALDILSCVTTFKIRHRPNRVLQVRIGIHTGPVVAGVVGLKMPRYCLSGSSVTFAAKMESSGVPMRIQASPECKTVLDKLGGFQIVERGKMEFKGRGEITTYFVLGKDGFNKILPSFEQSA